MKISVHNRCSDFTSYRAARVKSLFNAESGCNFDLDAELPIDEGDWRVGLIVGPSGSGKTSMGRRIFGPEALYESGRSTVRVRVSDDVGARFSGLVAAAEAILKVASEPAREQ